VVANGGTGMSDSERACRARNHAACLLHEAVRCRNPARRDGLLRQALARLAEARLLLGRQNAADYLNEAMDRIGQIVPQEISDDPQSRVPYTVFSHLAGRMVLAGFAGQMLFKGR